MTSAANTTMAMAQLSPQSWISVFLAEFKRIILRTRTLVALGIFALLSIGVTVGVTTILEWGRQNTEVGAEMTGSSFMGFGMSVSVLTFTLGLLCASSTARDYGDGASAATLVVVPKRSRLLSARLVVWILTALVVALVALVPLALMYMSTFARPSDALMDAAFGALGVCTLTTVGFAAATLLRRGALAVLTFLCVDFILPAIIGVATGFLPAGVQGVVSAVYHAFPGEAAQTVADASKCLATDLGTLLFGAAALVVWLVGSAFVAQIAFERYAGAGD